MQLCPTPDGRGPHVRYQVPLSGATYAIAWLWNERDGTWSFSMDDPSGEPLVQGVRVMLNVDLLAWAPSGDSRPPWPLVVIDPSGRDTHPGYNELGPVVKVYYADPDEEDAT